MNERQYSSKAPEKQLTQDEVDQQVAEFIAKGNKAEQVPAGKTGLDKGALPRKQRFGSRPGEK